MSDKLREALEAVLSAGRGPSDRIILERYQEDKLREALADDDAARGTMPAAYEAVESSIVGRYRVVNRNGGGFWPYCVQAGDGTMEIFIGHKTQCEKVAAALQTACLDGAFMASRAADDAARGTMREVFEALARSWGWARCEIEALTKGVAPLRLQGQLEGWQAATRAAAPIPVPNSRQLSEVIAEYEAMPERAAALADARASLKSAAPQIAEPAVYWPELPPFPTWISANDLHSLQEWAQTVRRDAFAAGMQRAARNAPTEADRLDAEPIGDTHGA